MKCPNCSNDMVQSRAGWLCLSCGHVEAAPTIPAAVPKITLGKASHAQMASAAKIAQNSAENPDAHKPVSPPPPVGPPEPETKVESPPATTAPPWDPPESVDEPKHKKSFKSDKPTEATKAADLAAVEEAAVQATAIAGTAADDSADAPPSSDAPPVAGEPPVADAGKVPGPLPAPLTPAASDAPESQSSEPKGSPSGPPADSDIDSDKPAEDDKPAAQNTPEDPGETANESDEADAPETQPPAPAIDDEKPEPPAEPDVDAELPPDAEPEIAEPPAAAEDGAPSSAVEQPPEHGDDAMPALDAPPKPPEVDQDAEPAPSAEPETPEPPTPSESPSPPEPPPPAASDPPAPEAEPGPPPPPAPSPPPAPEQPPTPDQPADQPAANLHPPPPPAEPPNPALAAPVGETATGAPAPPPPPVNGKPPLQPATHPKHRKFHLFGVAFVVVITLAASSAAVYTALVAPKMAFAGYLLRLGDAKTMAFSATVNNADSGYRFALKLNGTSDLRQASQPKLAATVSGDVTTPDGTAGDTPVNGQLTANLVTAGKNLYFKLTSLSLRSQVVGLASSANWYSLALSGSSSAKCLAQGTGAGSLLNSSVLASVPVKAASLVGFGSLNGEPALHFRGTVDTSKLASSGSNLSADCNLAAAGFKSSHLTYDIWRSWSHDRLELAVASTSSHLPTTLTLDTNAYNRPVAINTPAGAEDAANLFTNVLGASIIAPGVAEAAAAQVGASSAATAALVAPSTTASDTQIRADLAAYLAAYRARAAGGFFRTIPPAVTVATASRSYVIVGTKPTTPGQIWYQPGGVCAGPPHIPGRTATRYLALTTLLSDGQTPVCLDSLHS